MADEDDGCGPSEAKDSAPRKANDFAPRALNDYRPPFYWETRYPRAAWTRIWLEAAYLFFLVVADPLLIAVFWLGYPNAILHLNAARYSTFLTYGFATLAGALGGILFDLKWLYHTVAKGEWNDDRRAWRLFVPFISGGLAFAMMALVTSQVFEVLNRRVVASYPFAVGFSFLVGYFSDNAIKKLLLIAEGMFGRYPERHEKTVDGVTDTEENSNRDETPDDTSAA